MSSQIAHATAGSSDNKYESLKSQDVVPLPDVVFEKFEVLRSARSAPEHHAKYVAQAERPRQKLMYRLRCALSLSEEELHFAEDFSSDVEDEILGHRLPADKKNKAQLIEDATSKVELW